MAALTKLLLLVWCGAANAFNLPSVVARPDLARRGASTITMRHKDYALRVTRANAGRMRLCVIRSNNHIYAQVVDDSKGHILASASTTEKGEKLEYGGNCASAVGVGKRVAERALEKGIEQVWFDRNGRKYHGRIAALADAAREAGLSF
eukprot:CAMPEP_0119315054 /NCGR_PEP_ID=MMETSP1333-20130426/34319_1 /TAXON_ID=418940 /ORGANISM="Scyphosphaera apsteinii, Strain RCC1455" /LENGTH=148 /DNA_ID=CAMNT_0007320283 /DNA_START=22 /DNA_END=468 /DNA_ORIENTATION=+